MTTSGRCRWQTVEDEAPRLQTDRWVRYDDTQAVEHLEAIPVRDQRTYAIKSEWLLIRGVREDGWKGAVTAAIDAYAPPDDGG